MPRDDWAKYARRDKARKAVRSGNFDRPEKVKRPKPKKKPRKPRKQGEPIPFPKSLQSNTSGVPAFDRDNIPTWKDRPAIIFLRPPYSNPHPVPADCKVRH